MRIPPPPGRNPYTVHGILLALLFVPAGNVLASSPEVSGEVAASAWSSNRMLDDERGIAVARVKLAADWKPGGGWQLRADGLALSAPERLDGRRFTASFKELLVEQRRLPCAPALGKRFVSWGKTDALNPTDLLSPTHFRRLTPKETDQREGVWGLHLNCAVGTGRLQAHVLDHFRFNEVPLAAKVGVRFEEDEPRLRPSAALRYEVLGDAVDWSTSLIDGYDLYPTLALRSLSAQGVRVGREASRMRMLGADMALTNGSTIYRAEAAWVTYPDQDAGSQVVRRPFASAVVQAERSLGDGETIAIQFFGKQLRRSVSATGNPLLDDLQAAQGLLSNEIDRWSRGITLRYARPLWESRGALDIFWVHSWPRHDGLLRTRVSHALSDNWKLSTGFDIFRGPMDSYLGNLRANSVAFAEMSRAW